MLSEEQARNMITTLFTTSVLTQEIANMVLGSLTREADMEREEIFTFDWIQVQDSYLTWTVIRALTLFLFWNTDEFSIS